MYSHPEFIDGFHEGVFLFVRNNTSCVPPNTSVNHMKGDALAHKEQIALNLFVESIRKLDAAGVIRSWLGPFSTDSTRSANFWYEI